MQSGVGGPNYMQNFAVQPGLEVVPASDYSNTRSGQVVQRGVVSELEGHAVPTKKGTFELP